ncbi:hypothetical protein ACFE04_005706 [Oxalis oulophora]
MGVSIFLLPFILLLALPDVQSSNSSTSFSIKLIDKYSPESPFYPGNITFLERMEMMVRDSEARVSYLKSINERSSTPNYITPYVTNQGFTYVAEARVGGRESYFKFLLDTGSDLSWVLCKEDRGFHFWDPRYYNPYKSYTHRDIQCNDPVCDGSCKQGKCSYDMHYGDGSNIRGYVVKDSFWFKAPKELSIQNVLFLCADPNSYKGLIKVKGILAMSSSPKSFTSQISENIKSRFSYCLVPRKENGLAPISYLKFGNDMGYLSPRVQKTKFLKPNNLYVLELVDVSVDGKQLHYPPEAFRKSIPSRFVIDSGCAMTRLHTSIYWKLHKAFEEYFDRLQLIKRESCLAGIRGISGIQLCYHLSKHIKSFPTMTYHFKDGAILKIVPEQTFIINRNKGTIDLTVMLDPLFNILGAYQQQNTRFTFDNKRTRHLLCPPLPPPLSSPPLRRRQLLQPRTHRRSYLLRHRFLSTRRHETPPLLGIDAAVATIVILAADGLTSAITAAANDG